MNNAVLIVAAGRGSRLGASLPKQYLSVGDMPVLRRTVQAFANHPGIDQIQVVIAAADQALYQMATAGLELPAPVVGGATRQESVLNGLEALAAVGPSRVLIHDAARPFVSAAQINAVLCALDRSDGALPVLPLVDSIKLVEGEAITGEVDRLKLARAQTPQGFEFQQILQAHRQQAGQEQTDDAVLARMAGMSVTSVQGDEANFKITSADDLARANLMVLPTAAGAQMQTRVGMGFDVHRFAPDRPMMLCGVSIPFALGLDGHSDADVGLHAITDAVLGAMADGDIGDHFPPSDPKWRGTSSDIFLAYAAERVVQGGGQIISIDVTIICEAPKVKPHRTAMRERVAHILGVDIGRVSIKATTTERLGFTGRAEGIAAQAVASVALPANNDPMS